MFGLIESERKEKRKTEEKETEMRFSLLIGIERMYNKEI